MAEDSKEYGKGHADNRNIVEKAVVSNDIDLTQSKSVDSDNAQDFDELGRHAEGTLVPLTNNLDG